MAFKILGLLVALTAVVCCAQAVATEARPSEVIVETKSGLVRGGTEYSRNGSSFYVFKGIPYADKPLRFQISRPVTPWTGVRDALEYGSVCPQISLFDPSQTVGDEDCLFLNVFYPTEDRCGNSKLPVLFHIHGGGFYAGAADFVHPGFFMDDCVVFVSTNYRLAAAGFLTTKDEILPGNLGLKDQLLALKWANENIEYFRGDKEAITINGGSAGAMAVSHFVASPAAKGLFQRAILQSGSSLAPLCAMVHNPVEIAYQLGASFNCTRESSLQLRDCLRKQSIADIVVASDKIKAWRYAIISFGPVVEPADAYQPFVTENPYLRFKRGDINRVPIMTGFVRDEGYVLFATPTLLDPVATEELNNNWREVAPKIFGYAHLDISERESNDIADKIRDFYFGDKNISMEMEQELADAEGDRTFVYPALEESILHSQYAPVYQYALLYEGSYSAFSEGLGREEIIVTHGHEAPYFIPDPALAPLFPPGSEMFNMSVNLIQLWASFVKTGVPTNLWGGQDHWAPFTARQPSVLTLDAQTSNVVHFRQERMDFWASLNLRELEFSSD